MGPAQEMKVQGAYFDTFTLSSMYLRRGSSGGVASASSSSDAPRHYSRGARGVPAAQALAAHAFEEGMMA
jgi:hypothetical protein